jgi:predicted nucleotidyltransferase
MFPLQVLARHQKGRKDMASYPKLRRASCEQVEQLAVVTARAPTSRDEAAALLMDVLASACPAGEVSLIGSMARPGEADSLSDIDLSWTLPHGERSGQLQSLRPTLQRVGKVESLRVDPEARPDMRLVFVRFEGWPLWWRLDLEIHAAGLGSVDIRDADPWSPYESACMGVVVTLKALARNRPVAAEDLLALALQRLDAADVAGDWPLRIDTLLDHIETDSPPTADLVARTRQLSRQVFGEWA